MIVQSLPRNMEMVDLENAEVVRSPLARSEQYSKPHYTSYSWSGASKTIEKLKILFRSGYTYFYRHYRYAIRELFSSPNSETE